MGLGRFGSVVEHVVFDYMYKDSYISSMAVFEFMYTCKIITHDHMYKIIIKQNNYTSSMLHLSTCTFKKEIIPGTGTSYLTCLVVMPI